jgi:hypothetical protein
VIVLDDRLTQQDLGTTRETPDEWHICGRQLEDRWDSDSLPAKLFGVRQQNPQRLRLAITVHEQQGQVIAFRQILSG